MSDKFVSMSCAEFTETLASKAPIPGGGGASALVGALGIALCSMVGNLTVGHEKYADVESDVYAALKKGEKVQTRLLKLVDRDAKAFEPLSRAYSIPKDDPSRAEAMNQALSEACAAPLEMMRCCCEAIDLLEEMLEKGSVTLVSDVGVGALCCKAALESASLNIFINTKSMSDRDKAKSLEAEADAMLEKHSGFADKIAKEVTRRLRTQAQV